MRNSSAPKAGFAGRLFTLSSLLAALLALAMPALGQTSCPETNGFKYAQWPNVNGGLDVWDGSAAGLVLADDWVCTNGGTITDIHLWGGWLNDQVDWNASFWLAVYTDVPASNSIPSHPGTLQWQQWFQPVPLYQTMAVEPLYKASGMFTLGWETNLYYYCFYPTNLSQSGSSTSPQTNWLVVYVQSQTGKWFGWKTTYGSQNDSAAYAYWSGPAGPPPTGPWYQVLDPDGLALDLSFKINTDTNSTPQQPCCPDTGKERYVQTPNLLTGIDVNATFWPPDPPLGLQWVLADDFPCTNSGPITDIHLWGSWLFDQRDPNAIFTLAIWSDVPTNAVSTFSHPGQKLWSQTYTNGQYWVCQPTNWYEPFWDGYVDPDLGVVSLGFSTNLYYLCFNVDPTNGFTQTGTPTAKTNYWLSLAVKSPLAPTYFGWKSSADAYNDAAVAAYNGNFYPNPGDWMPMYDPDNYPLNLAFRITTSTGCPPAVITCPTNKTIECGSVLIFDWPTIQDPCCPNATITPYPPTTNTTHCPQLITQTWRIDDCGVISYCSQIITNQDTLPPVFNTLCVTNVFVVGSNNFAFPVPASPSPGLSTRITNEFFLPLKGFDDCSVNSFVAHTFSYLPGCITAATLKTRLKPCGDNCINDTLELSFTDSSGTRQPVYWGRFLGAGNSEAGLLADNWCNHTDGYVFTFDLSALPLAGGGLVNLLPSMNLNKFLDFICEDDSGVDYVELILVSCCCAPDKTVQCDDRTWNFDTPTAWDQCSGVIVPVPVLPDVTNGVCPKSITRTWIATDSCSNSAICSQTVTVVDTNPPTLLVPTGADLGCNPPLALIPNDASVRVQVAAFDNCCITRTNILDVFTGTACTSNRTFIITAWDCCSNSATKQVVYTWTTDTTPPSMPCPTNIVVTTCAWRVQVTYTNLPTITDNCSSGIVPVCSPPSLSWFTNRTTTPVSCTATDGCGNSTNCHFLVIVQAPASIEPTISRDLDTITIRWTTGVLEYSDNLLAPLPWSPVAPPPPGPPYVFTTPAVAAHMFYRVYCAP